MVWYIGFLLLWLVLPVMVIILFFFVVGSN
jgi:hypothetical protein